MRDQQHRLRVYSLALLVATEVAWAAMDDFAFRYGRKSRPDPRFGEVTTIPTQAVDKGDQPATRSSLSTMANRHQSQPRGASKSNMAQNGTKTPRRPRSTLVANVLDLLTAHLVVELGMLRRF